MIKQTEVHIDTVKTDGCLFMDLLSFAEIGSRRFTAGDVSRAYRYVTPWYMRDDGTSKKNRCYVLDHEEIARCGFYLMGDPDSRIEYAYRKDGNEYVIGNESTLAECTHFIKKIRIPGGSHFIRTNSLWETTYNPGVSDNDDILSYRGYIIW